jgi:hypothetical protein
LIALLAHLASASHRTESTLLRRFPERLLNALALAGFVEMHGLSPRSWRVTLAGRNELRRARAAGRRAA